MGSGGIPGIYSFSRTASDNLPTFRVDPKPCKYIPLTQNECLPTHLSGSQGPKCTGAPMPDGREDKEKRQRLHQSGLKCIFQILQKRDRVPG